MNNIYKFFSIDQFKDYIYKIQFNGWTPNFVVVHNTSSPTQALYKSWHNRPGWTNEQWLRNLASYYAGMGWQGCPHLFVGYDGINVLNDLTIHGTHSPSWNKFSWGVETVAEFDQEPFDDGVRTNLVAALAIMHSRIGLNPADFKLGVRGLHFHKEDVHTTHKDCPGKNLVKQDLINEVLAYMNKDEPIVHPHISEDVHTVDASYLTNGEMTSTEWLQHMLNVKCGTKLIEDGKMGDKTKQAVSNFQSRIANLKVDGIAGPITRLALKNYNLQIIK